MFDPKDPSRAVRRHHRARLLKKRRFYHGFDHAQAEHPASLGRLAKTPRPCSCAMCGNPRKFFDARTVQELRGAQELTFFIHGAFDGLDEASGSQATQSNDPHGAAQSQAGQALDPRLNR
jgi:hypothetical protein